MKGLSRHRHPPTLKSMGVAQIAKKRSCLIARAAVAAMAMATAAHVGLYCILHEVVTN